MVQFPEKDNGYVMVLVSENIYFFESDGTIINKADLKDIIDDDKYCLIPYKKEGNILYYLIAYNDGGVLIIKLFTFNIDTQINSVKITYSYNIYVKYFESTNVLSTKIIGINCLFTANSIRDYDILTCFYSTYYPTEIHEKSFDPNNDFEEITELFQYFYLSAEFPLMYSISAMTSLDKQKIIIICVCEQSFWITFNFNDFFSEAKYIFDDNSKLVLSTYNSKLYYFRHTNEYLFSSTFSSCTNLVMIFNNDFTLKEQQLSSTDNCDKSFTHSIILYRSYYNVVIDNGNIDSP